jgi:hypothetical protein
MRIVLATAVATGAGACGEGERGGAPTVPIPPAAAPVPVPGNFAPVRILSGGDSRPVAKAVVLIDGDTYQSTDAGEVMPSGYFGAPTGAEIDVEAPGFLPRRTRIDRERLVVLWPVADDAEAEAVREMVYGRDPVLVPPSSRSFSLAVDGPDDVRAAWHAEATTFGAPFEVAYVPALGHDPYDPDWISVGLVGGGSCEPVPAWGFCRGRGSWYEVVPAKARDRHTIRRVLASRFLGPNPLPGLMNADAPAAELSALETQTIRMILLRRLPNRWPDSDR